jgi:preprotein translocase subunit SecD
VKPQEALQRALEVLKRRAAQSPHMLNPQIQSEGERFIRLQVTGVDDLDGAIKRFTQSGVMQVKLVDETHLSSEFVDSSGNTRASKIPAELEVLRGVGGERTVLESRPLLPENCLEYAKVIKTQDGHPAVLFQLNQAGTAAFTEVTTRYIGRKVAIVVNGMTYTVAKISEPISHGQVVIDGLLTLEETEALAASMQTGALPFPVKVVSVQATPISPLQFSMIAMGVRSYSSLVRFFLGLAVFSLALIGWFLVKLGRMGTASN